jgi:hypothetical protein
VDTPLVRVVNIKLLFVLAARLCVEFVHGVKCACGRFVFVLYL